MKALTTEQKAAKWDELKRKEQEWIERAKAKKRVFDRKVEEAGIVVTPAEIEQELKRSK